MTNSVVQKILTRPTRSLCIFLFVLWISPGLVPLSIPMQGLRLGSEEAALAAGKKEIVFASLDGLKITADLYHSKKRKRGFILFFHQAASSRGEYTELSPLFTKKGYNLMAIDQRSGQAMKGVTNKTAARAVRKKQKTDYLSAVQDLMAAILYVRKKFKTKKLILCGSSYSAALVLKIAGEKKYPYHAVLSFSPGEYFGSKNFIGKYAKKITVPVWLTSSKSEGARSRALFKKIPSKKKTLFIPQKQGRHGARALWQATENHSEYRKSLFAFLKSLP